MGFIEYLFLGAVAVPCFGMPLYRAYVGTPCPLCRKGKLQSRRYPEQFDGETASLATCSACGVHFRFEESGPRKAAVDASDVEPSSEPAASSPRSS